MMKNAGITLFISMLMLGGIAHAGTQSLVTAPINSVFGDSDTVFCNAVNIGTKPIDITFESRDVNGVIVSTLGPITVQPGAVHGLQEVATSQYCRFLIKGSKKNVRAQAVYYNTPGTHYLLSVPAQ